MKRPDRSAGLRTLVGVILVVVGWAWSAAAQPAGVASLLELGLGARPLGLGGAFVGVADAPETVLYNPAGLAFLADNRFSGFAGRPFGALTHLGLSLAVPMMGLNLTQLSAPGALETNAFGNPTGRFLDYASRAGVAGLGFPVLPSLALGAALKVYREDSGPVHGFGWALDPAMLFASGPLRLGAVWRNSLSADVVFSNGYREAWPGALTLGGSWLWRARPDVAWRLAADVEGLFQGPVGWHWGGELTLGALGLRLGWNQGLFSVGAGVVYQTLRFDWTYAFHDTLPRTLNLSAAWTF